MPDSEEHALHQATIVNRAGKSTGKYCSWYNIQFAWPESKSGQATVLDLGNVLELTVVAGSNSPSQMYSVSQLDEMTLMLHSLLIHYGLHCANTKMHHSSRIRTQFGVS